ncbi:MAG: RNA 2',3'-cyclic phosphodiesterase [Pseudomonadota bacterium]
MPRLFTALSIPDDVRTRLSLLQGGLANARWIDPADFHLTLNFLGCVDGRMADDVDDMLAQIGGDAFQLRVDALGCFGSSKPRAVYALVEMTPELRQLQASIDRALRRLGVVSDKRAFVPHITLARLSNTPSAAVARWLGQSGQVTTRFFDVDRFGLFSSKASRGGGPYRLEETYRFVDDDDLDAWWRAEADLGPNHVAR